MKSLQKLLGTVWTIRDRKGNAKAYVRWTGAGDLEVVGRGTSQWENRARLNPREVRKIAQFMNDAMDARYGKTERRKKS